MFAWTPQGGRLGLADAPFFIVALAGLVLCLSALFAVPWFAVLEAAYYQLPETGYLEHVHVDEFRNVTKVDSFRAHMVILGAQAAGMAPVLWWYIRRWAPGRREPEAKWTHARKLVGVGLSLLAGAFIMGFGLGCFISLPSLDAVCALYRKEGPIDMMHSVGFLVASGLFVSSAYVYATRRALDDDPSMRRQFRITAVALVLFGAVSFFIGMEEISWGQTYLGWETPPLLMEINAQQETNVHNIFNGYIQPIYYIVGALLFIGTLSSCVIRDLFIDWMIVRAIFPPRLLVLVALWFPIGSEVYIYSSTEVFETLMTIYVIAFAGAVTSRALAVRSEMAALSPARPVAGV